MWKEGDTDYEELEGKSGEKQGFVAMRRCAAV